MATCSSSLRNDWYSSNLSESFGRERWMLQYALEREVTEAWVTTENASWRRRNRRNGYESHRVLTGEGAVTDQVPQIRSIDRFSFEDSRCVCDRTEKLDDLIATNVRARDVDA